MNPGRKKPVNTIIPLILIIVLGCLAYFNSIRGGFIWDDDLLITGNSLIRSWSHIADIFIRNIATVSELKYQFYRPIQIFSYLVDYSLWQYKAQGYHLTNVLLHISVALCIYFWVIGLSKDRILGFLTSAFFVVHPIHTEAVSYISGRADSLAALLLIISFIAYIKLQDSDDVLQYAVLVLGYVLALLSRENSLIAPFLFLFYHYAFRKKIRVGPFLSIIAVASLYIILRIGILKIPAPHSYASGGILERLPGFFVAVTNYIKLLFLPFGLHMEYGNKLFSALDPKAIAGFFLLSGLVAYGFTQRKKNAVIFFSAGWFIIALLPSSNIYPLTAYMAEHWLYLPSIGFFLMLAGIVERFYQDNRTRLVAGVFAAGVLAFFLYLTVCQNNYWRDPLVFYETTLKYVPDSAKVSSALGVEYMKKGKNAAAVELFNKAISIDPKYAGAYNNLGFLYNSLGKSMDAIRVCKKAIELDPNLASAYNNLGIAYARTGNREGAVYFFKKAISIIPNYASAYNNLGNTYDEMGRSEESTEAYRKAIEADPDYPAPYLNLAIASFQKGQFALAVKYCDKAVKLGLPVDPGFLKALKPYRK